MSIDKKTSRLTVPHSVLMSPHVTTTYWHKINRSLKRCARYHLHIQLDLKLSQSNMVKMAVLQECLDYQRAYMYHFASYQMLFQKSIVYFSPKRRKGVYLQLMDLLLY